MAESTGSSKRANGRGNSRAKGRAKSGSKSGARSGSKSGESAAFDGAESMDPERDAAARENLQASDKLYYRIGEVSRLTGVKAHVLRYWETEFRWMAPPKSRSKQRLYRKRDIEFVWLLKRCYGASGTRSPAHDSASPISVSTTRSPCSTCPWARRPRVPRPPPRRRSKPSLRSESPSTT